jgi:hypothetical protein
MCRFNSVLTHKHVCMHAHLHTGTYTHKSQTLFAN